MRTNLILIFTLFMLANIAYAEVYRWVDENGKVHFSDKKIGSTAEEVKIKTPSNSTAPQQGNSKQSLDKQKYLDYLASEREAKKARKLEKEKKLVKQKRICTNLKDQLKSLEEERAIWYNLDEDTGERVYLSEDELKQEISDLKKRIKSEC